MANITVNKISENQMYLFQVVVEESGSQTEHRVSLNKADYQRIARGIISPEALIRKSFEYLLQHEAKEKILPEFDFSVIHRYFPNFNKDIQLRIKEK